jgi:hypothetical protein
MARPWGFVVLAAGLTSVAVPALASVGTQRQRAERLNTCGSRSDSG